MFRAAVCCVALSLVALLGPSRNAAAAPACDGDGGQTAAPAKPLDIMKFMREQAASTRTASTRTAKPRQRKAEPVAQAPRPARRAAAARSKPAGLPVEAAASYAAQQPTVQIVASDEFNDIDRAAAATAAPAETTGAAIAAGPNVQLVDTEEFNAIDRKAEARLALSATTRIADAHASTGQPSAPPGVSPSVSPSVSWLQRIWSAVAGTFAALATAVHQLVGL